MREEMSKVLAHSAVFDERHAMVREEFEKYPVLLPLADIYCKQDIAYSYDEYTEHLELMKLAELQYVNYSMDLTMLRAFRNINIHILEGKWAVVSKNKAPIAHFVINQCLYMIWKAFNAAVSPYTISTFLKGHHRNFHTHPLVYSFFTISITL